MAYSGYAGQIYLTLIVLLHISIDLEETILNFTAVAIYIWILMQQAIFFRFAIERIKIDKFSQSSTYYLLSLPMKCDAISGSLEEAVDTGKFRNVSKDTLMKLRLNSIIRCLSNPPTSAPR